MATSKSRERDCWLQRLKLLAILKKAVGHCSGTTNTANACIHTEKQKPQPAKTTIFFFHDPISTVFGGTPYAMKVARTV